MNRPIDCADDPDKRPELIVRSRLLVRRLLGGLYQDYERSGQDGRAVPGDRHRRADYGLASTLDRLLSEISM